MAPVPFLIFNAVNSHNFNSHNFKLRASSPRTIAFFHFNMPFESSHLPGAGPMFPDRTLKTGCTQRACPLKMFQGLGLERCNHCVASWGPPTLDKGRGPILGGGRVHLRAHVEAPARADAGRGSTPGGELGDTGGGHFSGRLSRLRSPRGRASRETTSRLIWDRFARASSQRRNFQLPGCSKRATRHRRPPVLLTTLPGLDLLRKLADPSDMALAGARERNLRVSPSSLPQRKPQEHDGETAAAA